jgi:hypothetical protein
VKKKETVIVLVIAWHYCFLACGLVGMSTVNSKGFWWLYMTLGITGFLEFVHRPVFSKTQQTGWIYFSLRWGGRRHLVCYTYIHILHCIP